MEFTGLTLFYNEYSDKPIELDDFAYNCTITKNNVNLWDFIYNKSNIVLTITPDELEMSSTDTIKYKISSIEQLKIGNVSLDLETEITGNYDAITGVLIVIISYNNLRQIVKDALFEDPTITIAVEAAEPKGISIIALNCECNITNATKLTDDSYYYYLPDLEENNLIFNFNNAAEETYLNRNTASISFLGSIGQQLSEINVTPTFNNDNTMTVELSYNDIAGYDGIAPIVAAMNYDIYQNGTRYSVLGLSTNITSSVLENLDGKLSIPSYFTVISDTPIPLSESAFTYFRGNPSSTAIPQYIDTVIFPNTITTIYAPSFKDWSNINNFVFLGLTPPTLTNAKKSPFNTNVTGWFNTSGNIYVLDNVVDAYKTAWATISDANTRIKPLSEYMETLNQSE